MVDFYSMHEALASTPNTTLHTHTHAHARMHTHNLFDHPKFKDNAKLLSMELHAGLASLKSLLRGLCLDHHLLQRL